MASILKVTEITTPDGTGNITVSRPLTGGTGVKGGDIASASPLVIDTDGDYFDVTGTTNFAAMTVAADRQFTLQFDGVLTMTHHATNLDLPGEANITTAAGDVAVFQSTGSNTVQCINYTKADGTGIVAAGGGKVLQVVHHNIDPETSTSSSTLADTGVTVNITPASTSNKVLVLATLGSCTTNTNDTSGVVRLLRGATKLQNQRDVGRTDSTETSGVGSVTFNFLDSPSVDTEITYKLQFASLGNNAEFRFNMNSDEHATSITCIEIDGT